MGWFPAHKGDLGITNNSLIFAFQVGIREFCQDSFCEQRLKDSLRNIDLIKAIEEKINFPERRKAGTTQAHCLVKKLSSTSLNILFGLLPGGPFQVLRGANK